jgi:exopolyphosphatase/guanosine-5'-triphosphate,3'-diphosphate pyrophosphatase
VLYVLLVCSDEACDAAYEGCGELDELERRTTVTRLGQGVDASGRLAEDAVKRVLDALGDYREAIEQLEPDRAVAVATSAVRDVSDRSDFLRRIEEELGFEVRVITGDEEARLTFRGATVGRAERDAETVVVDIGGGSTEFVVGRPGSDPGFHVSTRIGSVRHTERHLDDDPPPPDQVAELADDVRETLARELPAKLREAVATGIAVAGTATSLAAIDQELDPYDPERVHGYRLSAGACERILAMLAAMPLAERREVTGLHPDRAPTIVAGAVILLESIRAFGLDEIEISEADILHGAALLAAEGEAD